MGLPICVYLSVSPSVYPSSSSTTTTFNYLHISSLPRIHHYRLPPPRHHHGSISLCLLTCRFQNSEMPNGGMPPQRSACKKGNINKRRFDQPHPCIPLDQYPPSKHATVPGSQRPHLRPMPLQSLQQCQKVSPTPKNPTSKRAHHIQSTSVRTIYPRSNGAQLRTQLG